MLSSAVGLGIGKSGSGPRSAAHSPRSPGCLASLGLRLLICRMEITILSSGAAGETVRETGCAGTLRAVG